MPNIYGVLPVLEALKAGGRRIDRIVIAEGVRDARLREVMEAARRARVPIRREPRVSLDRLTRNANHQGVIAITTAATYSDGDELLDRISPGTVFILLDGIEDPRNLGAIIRTAECGGASAVIVTERRAAHVTDAVAKTSAGAVEHLPVARVTNLASFIEDLKRRNVWVVGVEASGQMAYTDFDYSGALALVFGGEGQGLHRLVRERCDAVVSIPMRGKVTSLNVSVAVGIVLFEALRQRFKK
ncbi:MAG: 23S rRNA (guanosine(2251)-2'-O)-methyltransferase RlmB [Acidobacteriota bacterium]